MHDHNGSENANNPSRYCERLVSNKTEALFLALMALFLALAIWRVSVAGLDALAIVLAILFALFLFYAVNYRKLVIDLDAKALKLKFGVFTWVVALSNVESCALDDLPALARLGGAGIHFMFVGKRYRASFNFLEYPRLVIAFKQHVGPVQDISFSTQRPEALLQLIQSASMPDTPAEVRR